ncbi:hypothetical protein ACFSWE_12225 [Leucobacter albus]|uniref:Uncharacterized protein n=1 Tax=Leucobacter albus TaxID=272210 RepID=A0ABW3TRK1_9MICO
MDAALKRQRLVRVLTWAVALLAVAAWAVSLALEAPWRPWFAVALWSIIGVGLVARVLRRKKLARSRLDAFGGLNEIYLGRTYSPDISGTAVDSAEIGARRSDDPPPVSPLS